MFDLMWPLFVRCFGPDPWSTFFPVFTQFTIALFHFTNAYIAARFVRGHKDFESNHVALGFILLNSVSGLARLWGVQNIWMHEQPLHYITQTLTTFLSMFSLALIWKLAPAFRRLPSMKNLTDANQALAAKVVELEQERQEKERVQSSLLQSQKMEAVGRLTGGIAHDFNNLLLAISGNLELIKKNPHSERVNRWVGTGIDAVARAAHLTAQLLTFSRNQKLQLKNVKLAPVLTNIRQMISRTIGPDIQIALGNVADVTVCTDQVQLELAILNLSINARDAMPEGGMLTLSATLEDDRVEINVTDTGTGIPDEVAPRIFEPFFTTKDIGKGTGLGLSMVYGLATQSKGDVYIKKTSPKGTTITISLPIAVDEEPEAILPALEDAVVMCSTKTILLVDDDFDVRDTLSEILMLLGHNVKVCGDGPDALVYLKENQPDLVLMDYAMPVMNGAQVMKAAKLIHPDLEFIFITGFSESAELEGQIVLKKPFKLVEIRNLLQSVFHCTNRL